MEIGLGFGPMFFVGDLGGNYGVGRGFVKDVNLPLTKLSKGLYFSTYPAEWIGFRLALNHGLLEGNDAMIVDKGGAERYRKDRNLQFKSSVLEFYGGVEIYPTVMIERYDGLQGKLRPYGFLGVGAFKFNPKGEYYNPANGTTTWVPLQPLHLEGQGMAEYPDRKEYALTSFEIPMGIGAKYYIKDNFYVGMEILHRKTFTDYVDDVSKTYINGTLFDRYLSAAQAEMARQLYYRENFRTNSPQQRPLLDEQRGDPSQNDAFFSSVLKFAWRINDWNNPNGRATRQMRCPSFY